MIASLPFLERMVPGLPVWQLRHRALTSDKIAVLERLGLIGGNAFLVYSEDPVADEVSGQWLREDGDTWRVPADADVQAMLDWLHLGGWMLYSAPKAVPAEELYRMGVGPSPEALLGTASRLGLASIVVSFHDDVVWTIAVTGR